MMFKEKTVLLKNGTAATLKTPDTAEAEKMLEFIKKAYGETEFLACYPEECKFTVEQEEAWVESHRNNSNALDIACYVDGKVVGNCDIKFNTMMKLSHRASISIAVLEKYWNLGIGSALMNELISAAKERNTEIIELEFIGGNNRAKGLYEKFGFKTVCEKPKAFKLKDGTYRSEVHMQKYL